MTQLAHYKKLAKDQEVTIREQEVTIAQQQAEILRQKAFIVAKRREARLGTKPKRQTKRKAKRHA